MRSRALFVFGWLFGALVAGGLASAQDAGAGKEKEKAADAAVLERRLVDLELQVNAVRKHLAYVEEQQRKPAAGPEARTEIKIFKLKHAEAVQMARLLSELLGQQKGRLRLAADPRTNSLVVDGNANDLGRIEAIVAALDVPVDRDPAAGKERTADRQRKQADLKDRIALTRSDLEMQKDRAAWAQRMAVRGFLSKSQAEADQQRLQAIMNLLEQLQRDLHNLNKDSGRGKEKTVEK